MHAAARLTPPSATARLEARVQGPVASQGSIAEGTFAVPCCFRSWRDTLAIEAGESHRCSLRHRRKICCEGTAASCGDRARAHARNAPINAPARVLLFPHNTMCAGSSLVAEC